MELNSLNVVKDQVFSGVFSFNNSGTKTTTGFPADTFASAKLTYTTGDPDSTGGNPTWVQPGTTYIWPTTTPGTTITIPSVIYTEPYVAPAPEPSPEDAIRRLAEMTSNDPDAVRRLDEMVEQLKELIRTKEKQQAAPKEPMPEPDENDDAEFDTARFQRLDKKP